VLELVHAICPESGIDASGFTTVSGWTTPLPASSLPPFEEPAPELLLAGLPPDPLLELFPLAVPALLELVLALTLPPLGADPSVSACELSRRVHELDATTAAPRGKKRAQPI
jgi:hypothetical protein